MLKTNKAEISLIVYEYLKEEFKNKGLNWPLKNLNYNQSEINLTPTEQKQIIDALTKLSHSICATFNDNLNQMCLNIMTENQSDLVELDYESFKEVADELFSDGFKWLHIVCLLLFSTKLIIFKIDDDRIAEFAMNIYNYLTHFISEYLLDNINDYDSWQGLLDYFESINNFDLKSNKSIKFDWCNTNSKKFDPATLGFLGFALGFGIFLFNKN